MCRLGGCLLATKIVTKAATARSPRALATGWGLRPGEGKREVRRSPVRISVPSKKNLPQKIKVHPNYPNTLVALVFMQQMFNFIISYVHVCKYGIRYFQCRGPGQLKKRQFIIFIIFNIKASALHLRFFIGCCRVWSRQEI